MGHLPCLDRMWKNLPHAKNKDRASARLNTLIKRCVGFHPNRKWSLQLQASSKLKIERIESTLKGIMLKCMTSESKAIKGMAMKNARVTQNKRDTIADMTCHTDRDSG